MPDLTLADMVGGIGVALLLGAFALNLTGRLDRAGLPYAVMNALGAGLAALAALMISYWPFVVLEGTWCMVSLVAIGLIARRRLSHALS